jgi:molybdopterin/thiamine biosynthesis adenylyltransferase/nitroreductase
MPPTSEFSYDAAFERNLGWFTEAEQLALRGKRVAIAGMGGVGGVHLITLARIGIGAFNIADFDRFSLANFNRQIGANIETIGRLKIEVMEEMALAVNPDLRITRFDEGVNVDNLEQFLSGVDLFVDGLDFFVLDIRRRVFARCHELGIPAVTAGPIGMGTSLLAFVPNGMSFEQYFRMEGRPEPEQYLRFLVGLVPKGLHRSYLADATRLNLAKKTGPSTGAACQLCAGVVAIAAVKLLLRRGDVKPAPYSHNYDPFRGVLATTRLRFGLNGPLQRLKLRLARPAISQMQQRLPPPPTFLPEDPIDEILHAARWAPSGDNEQPWQFERIGQQAILIHVARQDIRNVYHYRSGEPNVLACGMLLESLRIAASAHGRRLDWSIVEDGGPLRVRVQFVADTTMLPDRLYSALGQRSVDRNRYQTRRLTGAERLSLEASLDGQLKIDWYNTAFERWGFARLSARATAIRLSAPETLPVHQRIIDWSTNLSPTKIPAGALGLRGSTLRIMRWAMHDMQRTRLLNRLGGTVSAALEMDYLPILCSAATFTLRFPAAGAEGERTIVELLEAGALIQRFWLTAAHLGLALQPELAVLIFSHYGQNELNFTADAAVCAKAKKLGQAFRRVFGAGTDGFVFMGRIGEPLPRMGVFRSVRKPVADLMTPRL